jgi:uncharacterized membrane protein
MNKKLYIKWSEIASVVVIVSCLGFSYLHRANYDNEIVTSWDISGNPTGLWSVDFVCTYWSIITVATLVLFMIMSRIGKYEPLTKKAVRCYNLSLLATELFFAIPFLAIISWNTGIRMNPNSVFVATFGGALLFGSFLISQTVKGWFTEIIRYKQASGNDALWRRIHLLVAIVLGISGFSLLIFAMFLANKVSTCDIGWRESFQLEQGKLSVMKCAKGYGDWVDVGQIKEGQDLGDCNLIEVKEIDNQMSKQICVKMFWKFNPKFVIRLVAIDKKGRKYPMGSTEGFLDNFEKGQQLIYSWSVVGLTKQELDYLKLQRRPWVWVDFEDFDMGSQYAPNIGETTLSYIVDPNDR